MKKRSDTGKAISIILWFTGAVAGLGGVIVALATASRQESAGNVYYGEHFLFGAIAMLMFFSLATTIDLLREIAANAEKQVVVNIEPKERP